MSDLLLENDPRPIPPVQPTADDCCHGGCTPCVFDLYDDELERYEAALRAWEARQAKNVTPADSSGNR